jgi:hypothetical protein
LSICSCSPIYCLSFCPCSPLFVFMSLFTRTNRQTI